MNLRDLDYAVAIADNGHFGRAAEQCHVSQSTLSIQIKKLEDTLGVQLFERNNRQVLLTEAGQAIITRARAILEQADAIRQLAKDARDPLAGTVTLGAFPTLAPYLFPLCMSAIKLSLPQVTLQLVEEKTKQLLAALEAGQIDCALVAAPVNRQGLKSIHVFYEPFYLAVPADHPFRHKTAVTEEELATLDLLLLDEGHCLRAQALDICHAIGSGEAKQFRATSLETLRQMVMLGNAVTLMPQLAVQADNTKISYIPFTNQAFGRTIVLCWRETSARGVLFERLAGCIRRETIAYAAIQHTSSSGSTQTVVADNEAMLE